MPDATGHEAGAIAVEVDDRSLFAGLALGLGRLMLVLADYNHLRGAVPQAILKRLGIAQDQAGELVPSLSDMGQAIPGMITAAGHGIWQVDGGSDHVFPPEP